MLVDRNNKSEIPVKNNDIPELKVFTKNNKEKSLPHTQRNQFLKKVFIMCEVIFRKKF